MLQNYFPNQKTFKVKGWIADTARRYGKITQHSKWY